MCSQEPARDENRPRRGCWMTVLVAALLAATPAGAGDPQLPPTAVEPPPQLVHPAPPPPTLTLPPPLEISFRDAPAQGVALRPVSGWPLAVVLEARREQLAKIGLHERSYLKSLARRPLVLAFEDLAGAPRPLTEGLEVTPGSSFDFFLNDFEVWAFNPGTGKNDASAPIGPEMGAFGRNVRLPGLVLLADSGLGVLYDKSFNRPPRLVARNLARFFSTVSYQLKNTRSRVAVEAHMAVPLGLFTPVVLVDNDATNSCHGTFLARIDGGPRICGLPGADDPRVRHNAGLSSPAFLQAFTVTLRAFAVRGRAPETLEDLDEDGEVDIDDARQAGLVPLSEEAVLRFRHYPLATDADGWTPLLFDFDGNGRVGQLEYIHPIPGSPATLVDPPP